MTLFIDMLSPDAEPGPLPVACPGCGARADLCPRCGLPEAMAFRVDYFAVALALVLAVALGALLGHLL